MKATWSDRRYLDLVGIEHPILQAPMAGANDWRLASEVTNAGGLGAIPCGMLNLEQIREEVKNYRQACQGPVHLNFFCHTPPEIDERVCKRWIEMLRPFCEEFAVSADEIEIVDTRRPFDHATCELVLEIRPQVVSFHYGLPNAPQMSAIKTSGIIVQGSATNVAEAKWLESYGADAVIAQGWEAGGHRGVFLEDSLDRQVGSMALIPQVVDAVQVPVIAAGGIGDARGVVAALALGASAVQLGTAFLYCDEAKISSVYRSVLAEAGDADTRITNLLTGRPARGFNSRFIEALGPMNVFAPPFPLAGAALKQLRQAAEIVNERDFSPCWSGQAAALSRASTAQTRRAADLLRRLAQVAMQRLGPALSLNDAAR